MGDREIMQAQGQQADSSFNSYMNIEVKCFFGYDYTTFSLLLKGSDVLQK